MHVGENNQGDFKMPIVVIKPTEEFIKLDDKEKNKVMAEFLNAFRQAKKECGDW